MVVTRLSAGLANAIMEYSTGYALAKELNTELVLDIGECQNSAWGYVLDYFNIPINLKYTYNTTNIDVWGHTSIESIPLKLRDGKRILQLAQYHSIDQASSFFDENVYLSDFFFVPEYYYEKYWTELRNNFIWRGTNPNIDAFKQMINGRISIGVHFRRGDMLYADFAINISDEYYKAAIEYCRHHIDRNALFCIFSDDIEYAEQLLGRDENIRYIHFLGYDDADLEEFICLSLCDHRIMCNNSTYSRVADRINGNPRRYSIIQGNLNEKYIDYLASGFRYVENECKNILRRWMGRPTVPRNQVRVGRVIINRYSKRYSKIDHGLSRKNIDQLLHCEINRDNALDVLKSIQSLELNHIDMDPTTENPLRYRKFLCYYEIGDFESAIQQADSIWSCYIGDNSFRHQYAEVLSKLDMTEEMECISRNVIHNIQFIIFPGVNTSYSVSLTGMGELAVALAKMGNRVVIVEQPSDDTEEAYIKSHKEMTNRHEVPYGCEQYLWDEVIDEGIVNFICDMKAHKGMDWKTIVISRNKEVFSERLDDVIYILPDERDKTDPEADAFKRRSSMEDIYDMSMQADYILTSVPSTYSDGVKLIKWENENDQFPYWKYDKPWQWHCMHRLSKRAIAMAETIVDRSTSFQ